ncbi:Clan CA, family C1, cathepsin L-like cysteine peptidase [Histomonas meleagridis]|uniref:Clan CA, family C1, cathepsin L-like cysteine peptidase n=1 Tax=Histomonas meleagridis TaxID=135588 RepID=UPI00355A1A30|nr:Clan CA, family C1, cathepsin L-like cysteine peptidase [Histomonas meleagridis]KAH0798172.1 Clan CA, family C1, cathepsin L-like cysteine peptidase [Histomonas meleagridis]
MLTLLLSAAFSAYYQEHEEKSFVSWMRSTNQIYTGDEYQTRFGVWMANQRLVQEHNQASTFKLSMNKFSAYTPSEYKSLLGFAPQIKASNGKKSNFKTNGSLDWREKGAVNDIKDQASCGSCWAFSAIQGAEGAYFLKTGKLLSLSEQNLVDCVTTCYGCNGGLMTYAYDYVIKYQDGKFMLEDDYPYKAVQGTCKFDASKAVGSISSYVEVAEYDEEDLAAKVTNYGPTCIAIDASHFSFQLYSSGIYDESRCSSTSLDHGVGCVGYGTEGTTNYWIVRNSWGKSWGEDGYIRMVKDKNNQCGVASMACVPIA